MTYLLVFIFLLTIVMGGVVWLRNPHHLVYRSFLALCIGGGLWTLTNAFFVDLPKSVQYIDALVSYAAMGLFATAFVIFCMALTNTSIHRRVLLAVGLILSVVSAVPGVVASDVIDNKIITTHFIVIYALWLIAYFAAGILYLFSGRKKVGSLRRQQIRSVLFGIVMTFTGAGICNLLLPILGDYRFITLGPVFSLIFLLFFGYTIVRHRLFDIRSTVARFITYGASVALLGAMVGYVSYTVFQYSGGKLSLLVFILSGMIVAALFPVTKNVFDYITRRVFFSSDYDMRKAIDTMTELFAASPSLHDLEDKGSRKLEEIIGAKTVTIVYKMPEIIDRAAKKNKTKLVVRDLIEEISANEKVLAFLDKSYIAICAPLIIQQKIIGYLNFSDKANGTSYNSRDIEFIDVIANEFAIALQNAQRFNEINQFNDELQNKVRDATSELQSSNKRLREIDASKDEFISMASHQLRTPLTSIKGYISMLLEGDLGSLKPEQRGALEEAYTSSQRMVYLIGDFLNLSRLQTGRFELERTDVSLPMIIREEIAQLRETAKARSIELHYDEPVDFPLVSVDETKIRQVMMNFIDNAIYYAKPSGAIINISLLHFGDEIVFKVVDNGIGVPASQRPHLFTKFYRADNARKARPDGTGIGLYMAKKVIIAHGGSIIFESKEGIGSTFGFSLPHMKNTHL